MFDFGVGWSELLLIGIVALIVIGPKELPGALRSLGQWMARIRKMAAEFQGQFQEAMREAEVDQLRKDMDDIAVKAKGYTQFDPIEDIRRDIERTIGDLPPADQPPSPDVAASASAADAPIATPATAIDAAAPTPPASEVPAVQVPTPAQAPASAPTPAANEPALAAPKTEAGRAPA